MDVGRCAALALVGAVAVGCLPSFDDFAVVEPLGGGGDGGWPPSELPLGEPCPSPHLALALKSRSSSGTSRLLRLRLPATGTQSFCRDDELVTDQAAFGPDMYAVTGLPAVGDVISTNGSVIGLDDDGFPRWRHQPWEGYSFSPREIFPVFLAGSYGVAGLYRTGSGSGYDELLVLDADGFEVTRVTELPYAIVAAAPHPDGTGRVVLGSSGGALRAYAVDAETTALAGDDGAELAAGLEPEGVGSLSVLEADLATGRLVASYEDALLLWSAGSPGPGQLLSCELCEAFETAAIDPEDVGAAYATCETAETTSLVHVRADGCTMVLDGTATSQLEMVDVALLRRAVP